jgi:hypothetical protein
MSDAVKNNLFTIVWQLAIRQKLESIEVGFPESTVIKIDPNAKFDSDTFDLAVSDLARDVDWQRDWKEMKGGLKSRNPKRVYKIAKRRFPSYRSIDDRIWDALVAKFRGSADAVYFERNEKRLIRKLKRYQKLPPSERRLARQALAIEITQDVFGSSGKPDPRITRRIRALTKKALAPRKARKNKSKGRTKEDQSQNRRFA